MIGSVATTIVELIIPQSNPLSNLKEDKATGKVTASFLVMINENKNSVHVKNTQMSPAVIIPPLLSGIITLKNSCKNVHPSINAADSTSLGIPSNTPLSIHMQTGAFNMTYIIIKPIFVSTKLT